jgi:signal transduction histidine kinase
VGTAGTITVRTERVDGAVRVSVRDTGPGMDEGVRTKLFEPFFSTRAAGEGTGLGLALCRRIVLAHGGTIRVDSAPGQGATFTVELPVSGIDGVQASAPASPVRLAQVH